MAEVFVGESLSVQGFKKKVAIKRVLPHLARNRDFIGMFLDEARLGARLNHANIVSVFDIGAADDTYFLVMEFVDGCNLKKIIETLRESGDTVPPNVALYIAMESCRGLSYAHELESDDGELLHIVHRDISPPNLLISKRGEVKVTDFGLAKATTQLERTDPGVVKGKFSYLSPEAALGQPVDARADVFAVGILIWEMLAGRRLFLGESDYATVKMVQEAAIPPLSKINSLVDEDLEALVNKALARDRELRHQSARELGDAIAGYLFSKQLKVTPTDIAAQVERALGASTPSAVEPEQHSMIDKLIQEELLRFTSLGEGDEAPAPMGAQPLSLDDVGPRKSADSVFENPADWFTDDDEVGDALEGAAARSHGWQESGLGNLASLEDDDPPDAGGGALDPASFGSNNPGLGGLGAELDPESFDLAADEPTRLEASPLGALLGGLDDALPASSPRATPPRATPPAIPAAARVTPPASPVAEPPAADPLPAAASEPSSGPNYALVAVLVVLLLAGLGAAVFFISQ